MPHQVRRRVAINLRRLWHAHRWHLLAALVVLPVLAAMVHSAVGGADPRTRPPTRAEACRAADRATDEVSSRYPEARDSLKDIEEQICTDGPVPAPVGGASTGSPVPRCHLPITTAQVGPTPVRAAMPARPIPFFAELSGHLPATGKPRVGGVQLPAGTRCGPFWSTDESVPDGIKLARKLAAAFPSTGLWPVLGVPPNEEPEAYNGGEDLARVAALDAEKILRRAWQELDANSPFPGLAAAEPAAERLEVEPFGDTLEASLGHPPGGLTLMLVPVTRPADVIAVTQPRITMYFSDSELTAVLRSWEERFGAVVTTISPGGVGLVVGAPPRDGKQLNRLAAELATFAPDDWTIDELQQLLRSDRPIPDSTSAHHWIFGWPD